MILIIKEMRVVVAKRQKASHTNSQEYEPEDALRYSEMDKNRFEVLPNDINRVHFDIDGHNLSAEITEDEFNEKDELVKNELEAFVGNQPHALMTSSSYNDRVISWRMTLPYLMMTRKNNEEFAKRMKREIEPNFPTGVTIDTGIYTKNRKMRMLYSNKDDEDRPLRLVSGNPIDTLISLTEGCTLREMEIQTKPVGRPKKIKEFPYMKILKNLSNEKLNEYAIWVECGIMIFNEDGSIEDWDTLSRNSPKYQRKALEERWTKFTKGSLTFLRFLEKHFPEEYENQKAGDYDFMKIDFETQYAKLMSPAIYIRVQGTIIQYLNQTELLHQHQNKLLLDGKTFVSKWVKDPTIKTYERMVFAPKCPTPAGCYNLFKEFAIQPQEGNIDTVLEVLKLIANNDDAVYDYLIKYFAYVFQTCKKTGVCIVVQSNEQGVGKDTFFNFIGSILGQAHFYNTDAPENNIFHNFNSGTETAIMVKIEEGTFNPANVSKFKKKITGDTENYTQKGKESITLDDHRNFIITTNNEQVVSVEPGDRRFLLLNPSSARKGDTEFWNRIYGELNKNETKAAFHHFLLNVDISNFEPSRDRIETDYYREAKLAFAPYHATFLQRFTQERNTEEIEISAYSLLDKINDGAKFPKGARKVGLDMRIHYLETGVATKGHCRTGASYVIDSRKLKEYLITKGWWVEM